MSTLPGFNLIGPLSSSSGMGVATRSTARLLDTVGFEMCALNIPVPGHELLGPHGLEHLVRSECRRLPYAIDILHVEPDFLDAALAGSWARMPIADRVNAIVPFWELSLFPEPWMAFLTSVDYVLAPSRHIMSSILSRGSSVPVLHYPQTISALPSVLRDRTKWGLADDRTTFLVAFDVYSDTNRKNPQAAIEAFRLAFRPEDPVALVIRMKNADLDCRYSSTVEQVREVARADPRVRLMEGTLSYEDQLSLYASVDVLVSLHRAEGLGLVLMEAMALGTPVIATGWSGNMDFMTPDNSALVRSTQVAVRGLQDYYTPQLVGDSTWAEPDLVDAAGWMRKFARDPHFARQLGCQAEHDIRKLMESADRLKPFEHLLSAVEAGALLSERHRAAAEYIRSRARGRHVRAAKKLFRPRAVVRRLRRSISGQR